MLYLLLATIGTSMISISMRLGEKRVKYKTGMLVMSYLTCIITGLCIIGPKNVFPDAEGAGYALGLGVVAGALFMSALVSCQYCISRTGIVLPSVFTRIGALLVPLGFSVLMFGEKPGVFRIIGSVLSIAGILMMTLKGDGSGKISHVPALILALIIEGLASSMTNIHRETGNDALSLHFLLYCFASAFLFSLILMLIRKERIGIYEIGFGIMMGFPNFMGGRFMLRALESIPATIVYPSRSVGALALITLSGVVIFREKLTRRQIAALAVIAVALTLLNI